jgi:sugar-specific transcriptional regulator TrmB
MENMSEVLIDLGFGEREAKIYLLLIGKGDLSALQIARNSKIDRTTIYDILEKLISKGVVSSHIKNKAKQFRAILPKELLNHFREKYSSLEKIIPELNKLTNSPSEKVICELFQGKEGLKVVLNDLIKNAKEYRVIGIRKEYEEILGYFNDSGVLKLNEFKAKEIAIVEKDAKFAKLKNGEYKYLDKTLLSPVTTLIYGNKVIFFIWTEPYFAVSIENKQLKDAQEEYFSFLWRIAIRL